MRCIKQWNKIARLLEKPFHLAHLEPWLTKQRKACDSGNEVNWTVYQASSISVFYVPCSDLWNPDSIRTFAGRNTSSYLKHMILFYKSEVKFDGFSLQGSMRTFPLLCIYERSEIKLTHAVLCVLSTERRRLAKSAPCSLLCILHTETCSPLRFWADLYNNG